MVEIRIPMGWASYLKDFIMLSTSVCNMVWVRTLNRYKKVLVAENVELAFIWELSVDQQESHFQEG